MVDAREEITSAYDSLVVLDGSTQWPVGCSSSKLPSTRSTYAFSRVYPAVGQPWVGQLWPSDWLPDAHPRGKLAGAARLLRAAKDVEILVLRHEVAALCRFDPH